MPAWPFWDVLAKFPQPADSSFLINRFQICLTACLIPLDQPQAAPTRTADEPHSEKEKLQ